MILCGTAAYSHLSIGRIETARSTQRQAKGEGAELVSKRSNYAAHSQTAVTGTDQHRRRARGHVERLCRDVPLPSPCRQRSKPFDPPRGPIYPGHLLRGLRARRRIAGDWPHQARATHAHPVFDRAGRSANVEGIWDQAVEIVGSLAERYLAHRNLLSPPPDVRFHRRCPYPLLPLLVSMAVNCWRRSFWRNLARS